MQKLDKKQVEVIVAVVLVVVFLGILLKPKAKKTARVYEKAAHGVEVVVGVLGHIASIQKDAITSESSPITKVTDESRNPFAILVRTTPIEPEPEVEEIIEEVEPEPEVEPEVQPPDIAIQGLLYQAGDPASSIAIIQGDEKRIGDVIDGWRIDDISENAVVLRYKRQKHTVKLY